jgi:hypothetical protein
VTRSWIAWGILSATGLVVLLLPDSGPRLLSLSNLHGPSLVDSLGILALVAGWIVLDLATWRRRRLIRLRTAGLALAGGVGAAAGGLVVWSVLGDHGSWWIVGALVLSVIQLAAALRASRPTATDSIAH